MAKKTKAKARKPAKKAVKHRSIKKTRKKTVKKPVKRTIKKKTKTRKVSRTSKKPKTKIKKRTSKIKKKLFSGSIGTKEPERKKHKGSAKPTKESFAFVKPMVIKERVAEKSEVLMKMADLKEDQIEEQLLKDSKIDSSDDKNNIKKPVKDRPTAGEIQDRTAGQKIRSILTYLLVVLVLLSLAAGAVFMFGLNDLRDDETFFVVVEDKGVPAVGVMYHMKERAFDTMDVSKFPATTNPKEFHDFSIDPENKVPEYDKIIIVNYNSFERVSSATGSTYNDVPITVDEMTRYFSNVRQLPTELRTDQAKTWEVKSTILGNWVTSFHVNVWTGGEEYNPLLEEYRKNNIKLTPTNGAMFMVKLCPLEKFFE